MSGQITSQRLVGSVFLLALTAALPTQAVVFASTLFWPSCYGGFRVQAVTSLPASNNWTEVSGTTWLMGNQYYPTNPATTPTEFYRLVSP